MPFSAILTSGTAAPRWWWQRCYLSGSRPPLWICFSLHCFSVGCRPPFETTSPSRTTKRWRRWQAMLIFSKTPGMLRPSFPWEDTILHASYPYIPFFCNVCVPRMLIFHCAAEINHPRIDWFWTKGHWKVYHVDGGKNPRIVIAAKVMVQSNTYLG